MKRLVTAFVLLVAASIGAMRNCSKLAHSILLEKPTPLRN